MCRCNAATVLLIKLLECLNMFCHCERPPHVGPPWCPVTAYCCQSIVCVAVWECSRTVCVLYMQANSSCVRLITMSLSCCICLSALSHPWMVFIVCDCSTSLRQRIGSNSSASTCTSTWHSNCELSRNAVEAHCHVAESSSRDWWANSMAYKSINRMFRPRGLSSAVTLKCYKMRRL